MTAKSDIIIVGSHAPGIFVRVKRIPKAGETVLGWDFDEPMDGGKGSNQAIAAARLGGKVSFVGCVGDDRIGREGKRWMDESGVDTEFLTRHDRVPSGIGFILLSEDGVPAMVTSMGANAEVDEADIDKALTAIPGSRIIMTQFELPVSIAMYAMERARELGKLAILNPGPAPEGKIPDLRDVSILIPNETEAQVLLGRQPGEAFEADELVRSLKSKTGINNVIITLGGSGIIGIDEEGIWQTNAYHVDVLDTSGAGDVFCASLAVAMTNGKDIREASDWANKVAAISVTKAGTIPAFPSLEDVNEFTMEHAKLFM